MSSLLPVTWDSPPRVPRQLESVGVPYTTYPQGHGPSVGIFFGFVAISVGLLFTWVMAKTSFKKFVNLPYTVIVFFFGVILSTISMHASDQSNPLVVSTKIWMNIDPDLMLYALLPPLLFTLPGAAFGAYMQGLVCFYMLPKYEWDWLFCLMVGAVLSATDPVSVVSMLKSVRGGTTSTVKLTYLITGESLLNDGTALVIFEAIVSMHYRTDFSVVMFFVKVLLISPLVGFGLGLVALEVLKVARRRLSLEHNTVQIAVTISCAYMSFFLAQYILKVSGIISTCAAGVVLAWLAPSLILQPEQMEVIWHMLEWVGNTMIFAIAGLIVGKYSGSVTMNDIWCIIIIYITMTLLRALMLSLCFPIVRWFHEEYSFKDVIFSTFGGLRGAISLALVLIIEKHLDDYSDVKSTMFIICAVVTLTICFNGSFCGSFFIWLYNSRLDNEVDEIIFHYVEKRIRRRAREFISTKDSLPPFDADEVKRLCSVFSYHYSVAPDSKEAREHLEARRTLNSNSLCKGTLKKFELNDELIMKFRAVFHGITRHCYMRQIQDGRVIRGSAVALALLHASRHGLETCDAPGLHDWDSITDTLEIFKRERARLAKVMDMFRKWPWVHAFLRSWDEEYERDRVFIVTSFLEAHNYAQRILARYLGEKGFVDSPEEQLIVRESTLLMHEAQKQLDNIDPTVVSFHATEMVARMVLNMADDIVMRFQEEGILNEQDSEDFFKKTNHDMKRIGSLHHRDEYLETLKQSRRENNDGSESENSDQEDETTRGAHHGLDSGKAALLISETRQDAAIRNAKHGWSWSRRKSVTGPEASPSPMDLNIRAILNNEEVESPPSSRKSESSSFRDSGSVPRSQFHPGSPLADTSPKQHTRHGMYSSDGMGRLSLHVDSGSFKALSSKYNKLQGDEEMVSIDAIDASVKAAERLPDI
eukprot:GSChrysophyteH1.ASY1.ANO1.549.1 assembled CDS